MRAVLAEVGPHGFPTLARPWLRVVHLPWHMPLALQRACETLDQFGHAEFAQRRFFVARPRPCRWRGWRRWRKRGGLMNGWRSRAGRIRCRPTFERAMILRDNVLDLFFVFHEIRKGIVARRSDSRW